jgi:hypothetical protein
MCLAIGDGLLHGPAAPMTGLEAGGCSVAFGSDRVGCRGLRCERTYSPAAHSLRATRNRPGAVIVRAAPARFLARARRGRLIRGGRRFCLTWPRLHTEGAADTPWIFTPWIDTPGIATPGIATPGIDTPGIDDRKRTRPDEGHFPDWGSFDRLLGCSRFGRLLGGTRVRHRPFHHVIRPPARARPLRAGAARRGGVSEFTSR